MLDAVLELNHKAIELQVTAGHGPEIDALQAKLHALITMAGVPVQQLHQCDLLTRTTTPHETIPRQTEAALLEVADAFKAVD